MAAELLTPVFAHLRAGAYTCAAGGTILLYDILLTTKDEIRYIWPSDFSLAKCLYLVNRYLPVPCLILGLYHLANLRPPLTTDVCKLIILSQVIGQAISLVAATWLLVIRVVALYGGGKIVTIAMYFVFLSTHVTTVIMSAIITQQLWGNIVYDEFVGLCSSLPPRLLGVVYFAPVICEVVLVAMQLFHAYRHSRRMKSLRHVTPLLRTLYADGFMYFVVVVSFRLWSAFMFIAADATYWYLSLYLEFSLISVSVSRFVLHLRRTAQVTYTHTTAVSIPLSDLTQSANNNPKNTNTNNHHHGNRQKRNSHQPPNRNLVHDHDHHRKKKVRRDQQHASSSSFQNAAETIIYPPSPAPSEVPQVRFSRVLGRSSSVHGSGVDGRSTSTSRLATRDDDDDVDGGGGAGRNGDDHESHTRELCYDDFDGHGHGHGGVGASRRADDDGHSYLELFPTSPDSRTERGERTPLPPSPPRIGDVVGGGHGYDEDVRMDRSVDARGSSRGIG